MAMLLGSRSRSRGRGGVGKVVRQLWEACFGRAAWVPEPVAKAKLLPLWMAVGAALVAFVGGYFLGGQAGGAPKPPVGLRAAAGAGPVAPGFVGEFDARPLTSKAFLVALYPGQPEAAAKASAKGLCDWLAARKVQRARPYPWATAAGQTWGVAVYYDGAADETATRNLLQALPADVPDPNFLELRKTTEGWPKAYVVR
ncbi:MAG: hypothetical protein ACK5S5_18230 [Planctomycetota bacterium]|jgi:hypothetical protein